MSWNSLMIMQNAMTELARISASVVVVVAASAKCGDDGYPRG